MIRRGLFFLFCLPFLNCETTPKKVATQPIQFKKEAELILYNQQKDSIAKLDIELATTDYERQTGMMYRREMLPQQGMLFVFQSAEPRAFYMKNTYISLDILFVNEEQEIFQIVEKASPKSLTNISSTAPAKYVLELLGGQAEKLQIQEGYSIKWTP